MKFQSLAAMAVALPFLLIALSLDFAVAQIGIAYGRNGMGLPLPPRVVEILKQNNIRRVRIYDTDHPTLDALRGSGIEVTVGILNQDLGPLASDPNAAASWVRDNIQPYHPDVTFRHVVVGNEVMPGNPDTQMFVPLVLPAMRNIHDALSAVPGLRDAGVKVTTAVGTEVVDPASNFPPENGRFRDEVAPYLDPIVGFLSDTGGPLFASVYPYFAYVADQRGARVIDIRYARLDPDFPGVTTVYGNTYKNLFYALLDAVNAAVDKSVGKMVRTDAGNRQPPDVVSGESGNPTPPGRGGRTVGKNSGDEVAAEAVEGGDMGTTENAARYINNLIQAVKSGTPLRPGRPIETYIFAMFDESDKPGDDAERNFGIFKPDGETKYPINFN
ncbi:glucan endo-1 3-beta-glucosidas [Striga asiatica]|uniref:Glucan endo-1 3-beta-glucosidas n=1 Tax=Striga asiatica TaxID=4170 RepID=A0A5A7Q0F1_STRAF|nr:glucan endo-1 3-beta-glucosidas [Striga asiatica]